MANEWQRDTMANYRHDLSLCAQSELWIHWKSHWTISETSWGTRIRMMPPFEGQRLRTCAGSWPCSHPTSHGSCPPHRESRRDTCMGRGVRSQTVTCDQLNIDSWFEQRSANHIKTQKTSNIKSLLNQKSSKWAQAAPRSRPWAWMAEQIKTTSIATASKHQNQTNPKWSPTQTNKVFRWV